ncbi:MAG: energy-coupling factor transporter transmembrane protein EcfT [Chloroflexi bacterium]|nr:energy-coupling factor transporter transmembrane protein EcfT [Chloroflexota bacterium]
MPLLTAYAYCDSPVHRLDPRPKTLWLAGMLGIIYSTASIPILIGCLVVALCVSSLGKLSYKAFLPVVKALLALGAFLLVVQTLFQSKSPVLMAIGPVNLYERGLWVSTEVTVRLLCMAVLFLQFLLWTHPTDITLMLVKFGLPYKYAMILPLALRFFPILEKEMVSIFDAQQARGLELNSTHKRLLRLAVILLPFCLRVMRRANDISLSMELRGFGCHPDRTFLREIRMRPMDYTVVALLALMILAWITARTLYLSR